MGKIDEVKDGINNTRLYMGFAFTAILAITAGMVGMYNSNNVNEMFWLGCFGAFCAIVTFVILARILHKKTSLLKDL